MTTTIEREHITGLILAGGQGTRMGGADKGLAIFEGKPLAQHALDRLGPQVGRAMISANRNLDAYRRFGLPVWPDGGEPGAYEGPLAGLLAGLQHCETPWLMSVPCDCPRFPMDLVARLANALSKANAPLAIAQSRVGDERKPQPVFCLLKRDARASLEQHLQAGKRSVLSYVEQQQGVVVDFDDAHAFANINAL